MAYHYEVKIWCLESEGKTSSTILITGRQRNQTQTRVIRCGFGFDGIQNAVDKSLLFAIASCKKLDSIFIVTTNYPYSAGNLVLNSFLSRVGTLHTNVSESLVFLEYKPDLMLGKEDVQWEDINTKR